MDQGGGAVCEYVEGGGWGRRWVWGGRGSILGIDDGFGGLRGRYQGEGWGGGGGGEGGERS